MIFPTPGMFIRLPSFCHATTTPQTDQLALASAVPDEHGRRKNRIKNSALEV
jgi:hypothetical protein